MCTTMQVYEPCACSYTWVLNPETWRMEKYRRSCVKHLAEPTEA